MVARKQMLTAKRIEKLKKTPGRYADAEVRGLILQVASGARASWILRYELGAKAAKNGKPRKRGKEFWLGLGAFPTFKLSEARERARKARQLLADGIDPIENKRQAKAAKALEAVKTKNFKECAEMYFEMRSNRWKSQKTHRQFNSTMRDYVFPILGNLPISIIYDGLVLRVFEQRKGNTKFWEAHPETASRVRQHIEGIFNLAMARSYRPMGPNPADWKR